MHNPWPWNSVILQISMTLREMMEAHTFDNLPPNSAPINPPYLAGFFFPITMTYKVPL
jgi:hypothetical protein